MGNRGVLENSRDDSRDTSRRGSNKKERRTSLVKKFYESFSFFSSPTNQDYDKLPLTESEDQDDEIIFNA
jgi:DNA replication protein DnaD